MYDTYGLETTSFDTAALAGFFATYSLLIVALCVVMIVAYWKIFTKAGKPGWASLIPFYNYYTLFQVAGMNGWMFLLLCLPIVNVVVLIMLYINLAKAFGKSGGFAAGLIFLNTIFLLILAFGSSTYVGKQD